ncbi:MAG: alpha/beta fold hydrolase [Acidimicrobiales bacterium]
MTANVSHRHVDTALGSIEYQRGGDGPTLVYLHSSAGEGPGLEFLWRAAEHFDVVAPVFPGFWGSEGIEQIDDMEDAVFHLLDVFDRLDLDRPVVSGLSLGGWLSAELATRYPDRIAALVLVNAVGLYVEGAPIGDIFGRSPAELVDDLFSDHTTPIAQLALTLEGTWHDPARFGEMPFDLVRPLIQHLAAVARLGWNPYLHNPKLRRRLPRITVPTLVVVADGDRLVPAAHAEVYAAEIPGARLELVPGAHMLPVERPVELAEVIARFCRETLGVPLAAS